ncbi:hypothetical protein [Methylobacterium aquaticum]|uniref:hypothetical protein n=1 Tax=Methylobacterium aquaticum TaxID=270351 RepID=UPI001933FD20|nr:hypothetical protein [Methylobacterium aquaticum]
MDQPGPDPARRGHRARHQPQLRRRPAERRGAGSRGRAAPLVEKAYYYRRHYRYRPYRRYYGYRPYRRYYYRPYYRPSYRRYYRPYYRPYRRVYGPRFFF